MRNTSNIDSAANLEQGTSSSPASDSRAAHHLGGRLFPLSIQTWFVVVLLVPLLIVLGVASTVVGHQLSTREQAESTRQSSLSLDGLLRARVDLYDEYIPSQAIVVARTYQVSPATLNSLLGVDVQAELTDSRGAVDRQSAFGASGEFRGEYAQLVRLRRGIDDGTASANDVATLFNQIGSEVDDRWQHIFNHLSTTGASSDSPATKNRLTALGLSFSAFTSGLGEENLQDGGSLETLLTTAATSAQVQNLVVSHEQFVASTRSFPASLGPQGAAAWNSMSDGPVATRFAAYVKTGIAVGLGHLSPRSPPTPPRSAKSHASKWHGRIR